MEIKKFADLWRGIFFLISSVSLIIVVIMFIFIWQPIWTDGFKDFHTISEAISKLDKTAKPASEMAPLALIQITEMNKTMLEMRTSMQVLEELNPNIIRMTFTMDQMNRSMSGQMGKMTYEVDQMGDKFTPFGMMPFNW